MRKLSYPVRFDGRFPSKKKLVLLDRTRRELWYEELTGGIC